MNDLPRRCKRGDTSPDRPGLLFFRYANGLERWVTPEVYERSLKLKRIVEARVRATPEHKERMRKYFRTYNNTPKQKAYHSAYYKQEHIRQKCRDRYSSDPELREKVKAQSRSPKARAAQKRRREDPQFKVKNRKYMKPYLREYSKRRYATDPEYRERCRQTQREWCRKNRHKVNITAKKSRLKNPNLAISIKLRNRVRGALRAQPGSVKQYNTEQMIGCTMHEFVTHLQMQFSEGMSISGLMNGKIHIDHRMPCAMFDLTKPEQQLQCFNFRNLRPMWAVENIKKSDKVEVDGKLVAARKIRKIVPFYVEA